MYIYCLIVQYRDGRLRRNDQIIYINGRSLEGQPHSEAVKLLQSTRGIVELVISRDSSHTSAASPLTSGGRVPKWVTPPPVSLSQGSPLSPVKPHSETVVENGQHLEEESVSVCVFVCRLEGRSMKIRSPLVFAQISCRKHCVLQNTPTLPTFFVCH